MLKKELGGRLQSYLAEISSDGTDYFLLEGGTVKASIVHASRALNELRTNHDLGVFETLALGHGVLGASLLASSLKGEERLNFGITCSGPLTGFSIDADASGRVRGYLKTNVIELAEIPKRLSLEGLIGTGSLSVTRYRDAVSEPFIGVVELRNESIAGDLTRYYLESEQTRSAIHLSVWFDPEGLMRGACGIILQAMPGAQDLVLDDLDDWIHEIPSPGAEVAKGVLPSLYIREHFAAFGPQWVGGRPLDFHCGCERGNFLSYLRQLGAEEHEAIRAESPEKVFVTCHNCGTRYDFDYDELG